MVIGLIIEKLKADRRAQNVNRAVSTGPGNPYPSALTTSPSTVFQGFQIVPKIASQIIFLNLKKKSFLKILFKRERVRRG